MRSACGPRASSTSAVTRPKGPNGAVTIRDRRPFNVTADARFVGVIGAGPIGATGWRTVLGFRPRNTDSERVRARRRRRGAVVRDEVLKSTTQDTVLRRRSYTACPQDHAVPHDAHPTAPSTLWTPRAGGSTQKTRQSSHLRAPKHTRPPPLGARSRSVFASTSLSALRIAPHSRPDLSRAS